MSDIGVVRIAEGRFNKAFEVCPEEYFFYLCNNHIIYSDELKYPEIYNKFYLWDLYKKFYHAGLLTKEELDSLHNKVRLKIIKHAAQRLLESRPQDSEKMYSDFFQMCEKTPGTHRILYSSYSYFEQSVEIAEGFLPNFRAGSSVYINDYDSKNIFFEIAGKSHLWKGDS